MADSKITDLPTYTSASATPNGADVFAIVDVDAASNAGITRKITVTDLEEILFQDGTEDIDVLSGQFVDAVFDNDIQINGSGNVITTLLGLINGNTTNIDNLDGSFVTLGTKQDITASKVFDEIVGFKQGMKIGGALESASIAAGNNGFVEINGEVGNTSLFASHDIVAFSDASVKDNIRPIANPLQKIKRLNGRIYTRNDIKDKEKENMGLIAQEVDQVVPEVVSCLSDGKMGVAYQNLVPLLIEGIKDQQKQIDQLKKQIEEIK